MAQSFASPSVEPPNKPEDVARRDFPVVRRGYDQMQVRAYLSAVASVLRVAHTREAELRSRLASAVKRAHEAEKLDEATLTRRLGDETVRVLDTAREAAASIMANAEDHAATFMADAEERAAGVEERAAGLLAERTAEAEHAAEEIRRQADELLAQAEERAAELVEAGHRDGERLVADARVAREHILRDMDRRRRAARAQVERLKAGRDRLLDSFDAVQGTLDEAKSSLHASLQEAKVAADSAAARVEISREPGTLELEAEVEAGVLAGVIPTAEDVSLADTPPPITIPEDVVAADEAAGDEVVEVDAEDGADGVGSVDPEGGPDEDPSPTADDGATDFEPDRYESKPVALDPHERGGRRLRRVPVAASELSAADLQTVAVGDPVEEVSIVTPAAVSRDGQVARRAGSDEKAEGPAESEAEPEPESGVVEGSVEPESESEAESEPEPGVVEGSVEPEPEPESESEAESEPESGVVEGSVEPEPESEPESSVVEGSVESESESEAEPEPESGVVEGSVEPDPETDLVEDLFTRIRRDREEKVASAREKLGTEEPDESAATARAVAERCETVARRLKRVIAEDQNRVLDGLRRAGSARGRTSIGVDDVLPSPGDQLAEYLGAVVTHVSPESLPPAAEDRVAAILRRDLVDPLREVVESALAGVVDDGDGAAEELRARFRLAKNEWIPPLAGRLVARAAELSGLDGPR